MVDAIRPYCLAWTDTRVPLKEKPTMASQRRIKRAKPLGSSDPAAGTARSFTVLLSDELWPRVREAVGRLHEKNGDRPPILAAISYVTNDYFGLRAGDTLICDASDRCIEDGSTSARVLLQIHDNGAQLLSFSGLHAKVAVIGPYSMVGSANMTSNSERLLEAATWSTDAQIRESVLELVRVTMAQPQARKIDDDFLKRIEAIDVSRRPPVRHLNRAKIDVGSELLGALTPNVWMLMASLERKRRPRTIPPGPLFLRSQIDHTSIQLGSSVASQLCVGDIVFPALTFSRNRRLRREVIGPTRISRFERDDDMLICHFDEPLGMRETIPWSSVSKTLQSVGLQVGDRPENIELPPEAVSALLGMNKNWSLPKS